MKRVIAAIATLILLILLPVSCSVSIEEDNSRNEPQKITQNGELTVSIIDVGQGDSILIKTPGEKYVLVDSGSMNEKEKFYEHIKGIDVKSFEAVVATHPHEDHIGNLDNIIEDYTVENVYMPKVSANTKTFENLLNSVKQRGLKIKTIKAGVEFNIDNVLFEFMAPNSDKYEDMNNYSGVLKVTYGELSFILMGDAEKLSEGEMLKNRIDVDADVIKIGHHGSTSSSSKKFIEAVSPRYAVISCGEGNDYNHPHKETIQLLDSLKIDTFRTDLNGTITFYSDGNELNYFFE